MQVIVDATTASLQQLTPTGTSVLVEGELKKPPEGTKQKVEFKVSKILEIGPCHPSTYPIAKTKLPLEYLRNHLHLRSRTNTVSLCVEMCFSYEASKLIIVCNVIYLHDIQIAAVARIRNALAYAIHTFFQRNDFLYVHTPIITTSDCEGAGEMFQVATLFGEAERRDKEAKANPPPSDTELESAKNDVSSKGEAVKEAKNAGDKDALAVCLQELNQAKALLAQLEARAKFKPGMPKKDDGSIDYSADFFARQAFLTVSGQLQVETYACGLSNVYTFGPTFRAENSHTTRHLAEFWMVEPEIAFADLEVK